MHQPLTSYTASSVALTIQVLRQKLCKSGSS